jgi:glycosyltransferase involved in cell wall biosynthesis
MITIIICFKGHDTSTIYRALESCKKYPVILITKNCLFEFTESVKRLYSNVYIINQLNDGLGAARNLGLSFVKTEYVLMMGSDNQLLPSFEFKTMIDTMNENKWVGIGFKTYIYYNGGYLNNCVRQWFFKKIKIKESEVVGTPVLYKTEILKEFKYNNYCKHSDDTDLGQRLKLYGYKQGYSNNLVLDNSVNNLKSIIERWSRYGISDYEFYKNNYRNWSLKKKIKSWLHPLTSDWIPGVNYLPFNFLIIIIRYSAWIKEIFKYKY